MFWTSEDYLRLMIASGCYFTLLWEAVEVEYADARVRYLPGPILEGI